MKDYFKLREYERSNTAHIHNIKNKATDHQVYKFSLFKYILLNPMRVLIGKPITISSGLRSSQLNKLIKGAKGSQHLALGDSVAVDLTMKSKASLIELFDLIKISQDYDQLILEKKLKGNKYTYWVHVSYNFTENRNQILLFNGKNYQRYLNKTQLKNF